MAVYLHVTLEVRAPMMTAFNTLMQEILPVVEGAGWRLLGAFVQRTGKLNTVIDLWELEDYDHLPRGFAAIASHPEGRRLSATLAECVSSETLVFAERAPYMR